MHTRTHPPFATLLQYWILKISNLETLAIAFFVLGSLSFLILHKMLFYLGFDDHRRKWLMVLFAVIPSVNIYLLVSLDALILTTTLVSLLGVSRIFYKKRIDGVAFFLVAMGVVLTNLLTFSGLFLFAFLGFLGLYFLLKRDFRFIVLLLASVIVFIVVLLLIYFTTGYNNLETFLHASHSENPKGFRLLYQPFVYFMTRLEGVGEILFFLSFGFLAILFSKKERIDVFTDKNNNILFFSAIAALSAILITGAYGTGETARACLFMTPFFLILLKNIENQKFEILYYLCLFQTFGMQMIANFYW